MSFAKRQQLEEMQNDPGYQRDMEDIMQQEKKEQNAFLEDYAKRIHIFLEALNVNFDQLDSRFLLLRDTYSIWLYIPSKPIVFPLRPTRGGKESGLLR